MRLGLRRKLLGVFLGFAAVVSSVAIVSHLMIERLEAELLAIYGERVVPLRVLKGVSDRFAVDVVDSVHKAAAGRAAVAQAERSVAAARASAASAWRALAERPDLLDAAVLHTTDALMRRADRAAERAELLLARGDLQGLELFRRTEMYAAIDPLTARLEELVGVELLATDRHVQGLNAQLRALRTSSSWVLIGVSLSALVLAVVLMRRFVHSIAAMEDVVRGVASGDLSRRVKLRGADELANMANDVDQMIDALASSRSELETRSQALAQAAKQAHAASVAKSLFLSAMSHELRTPLNVMLGYAQLMVREPGRSERDRLALDRMVEASRHLLGLIEDVLSISKIEAGKLLVRSQPFAPHTTLASVEGLFRERALAKGLTLRVCPDATLPACLLGDEGKLRQVLVNLVGNAIKFTADGEVRVALWHEADMLHGSVSDTGAGIAPEERERLFETFYQGSAGRDAAEGTGLGLYISSQLVHAMGGVLELNSTVGVGSEFHFSVRAPQSAELQPTQPLLQRIPHLADGVQLAPMLVVDDRPGNRELLGRLLRDMGFRAIEVADGQAAIDACAEQEHALVWMDLRMPGLDGRETLRRVRSADRAAGRSARKVVAITASVLELDRAEAQSQGFDDLVNKPFRVEEIVSIVERHLGLTLVQPSDAAAAGAHGEPEASPWQCYEGELAEVPLELRTQLLRSLVAGDVDEALQLIESVRPAALSRHMGNSVQSFQFDALIDTLRALGARAHHPRMAPS